MVMLELQFKNLSLNIVSRPRTSSYLVELSLGGLYLHDKLTLNTVFPVLVGPPGQERMMQLAKAKGPFTKVASTKSLDDPGESLFYLAYERKPENSHYDYRLVVIILAFPHLMMKCIYLRLNIKSKSLDVVYQPSAVKWLVEFLCLPHQDQRIITQMRIEAVKIRTKKELIKNWDKILDGSTVFI